MPLEINGGNNAIVQTARSRSNSESNVHVFARKDNLQNAPTLIGRTRSNSVTFGNQLMLRQSSGVGQSTGKEPRGPGSTSTSSRKSGDDGMIFEEPVGSYKTATKEDLPSSPIPKDRDGGDEITYENAISIFHDPQRIANLTRKDAPQRPQSPIPDEPEGIEYEIDLLDQMNDEVDQIIAAQRKVEKSLDETQFSKGVKALFDARQETRTTIPQKIAGFFRDLVEKISKRIDDRRERKELAALPTMQRIDRMHEKMVGGPSWFKVEDNPQQVLDLFTTEITSKSIPTIDGQYRGMANVSNMLTKILGDLRSKTEKNLETEIRNKIGSDPEEKKLPEKQQKALIAQRLEAQLPGEMKTVLKAFVRDLVANATHLQRSKIDLDLVDEHLVQGFTFMGHKDKLDFVTMVHEELLASPIEIDPRQVEIDRLDEIDTRKVGSRSTADHNNHEVLNKLNGGFTEVSNALTTILKDLRRDCADERTNPGNEPWLIFLGEAALRIVSNSNPQPLLHIDADKLDEFADRFEHEGRNDKAQFCRTLKAAIEQARSPEGARAMFQPQILASMNMVVDQNTFFRGGEYSAVGKLMNALGKSENAKAFGPIIKDFVEDQRVVDLDKDIRKFWAENRRHDALKVEKGTQLSPDLAKRVLDLVVELQDKMMSVAPTGGMIDQVGVMNQVLVDRSQPDFVEKGGKPEHKLEEKQVPVLTHLLYNNELVLRHMSPAFTSFTNSNPVQGSSPTLKIAIEVLQKIGNGKFEASTYKQPEIGKQLVEQYGTKLVDRQERFFVEAGMPETARVVFPKGVKPEPVQVQPNQVKN